MTETKTRIPEKFINREDGSLNAEELLRSYMELEKRLSQRPAMQVEQDDGEIKLNTVELASDEEINKRLREAGMSAKQIALVYEIGEERLLPAIYEMAAQMDIMRERQKLISHFGSEDKYNQVISQVAEWASKNVRPEVLDSLGGTCEGILALYKMMEGREPKVTGASGVEMTGRESVEDLRKVMTTSAYWRDRDPKLVARVQEGFKRLYDK